MRSNHILFQPPTPLSNNDSLLIALFGAVIIHVVIGLGVNFTAPEPDTVSRAVDITLVNMPSPKVPEKAQALAQENQIAEGEQSRKPEPPVEQQAAPNIAPVKPIKKSIPKHAESKAPKKLITQKVAEKKIVTASKPDVAQHTEERPHLSAEMLQQQVAAMRKEQSLLLAQVKDMIAAIPPPQPEKGRVANEAIEQKRRQLLKLLAAIELRIEQDNLRPRKHYISPATREVAYAQYYDVMRRKIEERGTRNFPERMGQKIYGELTMIITINADGRVLNTEVVQASGNSELDRRAQAIAVSAGPFGEFTKEMRKQADQLAIISRFIFSSDNALRTLGEKTN